MVAAPPSLFDFRRPTAAAGWLSVADPVMGGESHGALAALPGGTAVFQGVISLQGGGGFASVRSPPGRRGLSGCRGVALRVRGDGKTYRLTLRADAAFDGPSWEAAFSTLPGAWTTVQIPFSAFAPAKRGRPAPEAGALDPARIASVGLVIGERQPGRFRLELASIEGWPDDEPPAVAR